MRAKLLIAVPVLLLPLLLLLPPSASYDAPSAPTGASSWPCPRAPQTDHGVRDPATGPYHAAFHLDVPQGSCSYVEVNFTQGVAPSMEVRLTLDGAKAGGCETSFAAVCSFASSRSGSLVVDIRGFDVGFVQVRLGLAPRNS